MCSMTIQNSSTVTYHYLNVNSKLPFSVDIKSQSQNSQNKLLFLQMLLDEIPFKYSFMYFPFLCKMNFTEMADVQAALQKAGRHLSRMIKKTARYK